MIHSLKLTNNAKNTANGSGVQNDTEQKNCHRFVLNEKKG